MTFTATPEVASSPGDRPRVRLDIDCDDAGGAFTSLTVTRDGKAIREQPFVGGPEALAFDYEALFGTLSTWAVSGTFITTSAPDWTETWASLASWTGDTTLWKVSPSVLRTNLVRNPKAASATTDYSGAAAGGTATVSRVVGGGPTVEIPNYIAVIPTGAGPFTTIDAVSGGASTNLVTPGVSYSFTPSYRIVGPTTSNVTWLIRWLNAGAGVISTSTLALGGKAQNTWFRDAKLTATAPALAVRAELVVRATPIIGSFTTISSLNVTGLVFEKAVLETTPDSFFDGDTTDTAALTYAWTGTANLSTSTQAVASGHTATVDGGAITRTLSGTGERFRVVNPEYLLIDILDASNNTIVTVNTASVYAATAISAGSAYQSAGPFTADSYELVVSGGVATARALTGLWTISVPAPGIPAKVRMSSLYAGGNTANVGTISATLAVTEQPFNATATATLDQPDAWLIHPLLPSLSCSIDPGAGNWRDDGINVALGTQPVVSRKATSTMLYGVGRARPVSMSHGNRLDGEWTLLLDTPRLEDRDTVQAIVSDSTPLLFRAPQSWAWDLPDGWYDIGDVDETRTFAGAGLQEAFRTISLPLTPIDEPIVRQGALWTYGGDLIRNPTYADSLAEFPTYLDRLAGPVA